MGDGWRGVGFQVADGWRGVGLQVADGWRGGLQMDGEGWGFKWVMVGLEVADGWRGWGFKYVENCTLAQTTLTYTQYIHYTHAHIQTHPVILRYCGEAGPPALPDRPEELPVGLQVCQPVRGGPQPTDC